MKAKTLGDFGRLLRLLRLAPKGKDRRYKKKGAFANARLNRERWIAGTQRAGVEVARRWAATRGKPEERRKLIAELYPIGHQCSL